MIDRRRLLSILFSLVGLAVLLTESMASHAA